MRYAANIDQQAIGRIKRRPRPPALRPQRQLLKERHIPGRIAGVHRQIGAQRAGIGQHRAQLHPGGTRGRVDRRNPRTVGTFAQ